MTAILGCRGRRPGVVLSACFAAAIAAVVLQRPAFAADPVPVSDAASVSYVREPVTVHLDQAKTLKLPERTATLVIGNPLIADAAVQPGGVVVITAKSYGTTNLIALDRAGDALLEYPLQVVGPNDDVVVVYRGVERESYSCAPSCARRIMIGDSPAYFAASLTQVGAQNSVAQGPAQK
jgi:Flp pilus assembly secretin CpaC